MACALLSGAAMAEKPRLPGVGPGDPRRVVEVGQAPWHALGRVQTELGGRCTGALVGPRMVLTAAHCLVAPNSGRLLRPGSVHFLRGYARGAWRAAARVASFRAGPGFDPARRGPLAADWALLTLERDIAPATESLPLWRALPPPGTPLTLGGYQQDRPELLMADPACRLLGVVRGAEGPALLRHGCAGTHGASGAPLLLETAPGQWAILGVAVAAGAAHGMAVPAAALP